MPARRQGVTLRRLLLSLALVAAALTLAGAARADGPTLVAAYAFDEGSGTVAADASGNGHVGTIAGAAWVTGRHGTALSFNGTNASVDIGGLGTFYSSGFTLEAWVQKTTATKNDVAVLGSWTSAGGGPMLWVDHIASHYQLAMNVGLSNYLDSGQTPSAGQWQHLAATYDGTTAHFYIDGTEVAARTVSVPIGSSNVWRIGAYGPTPGGFFDGIIDDVRIYNGALSAAQIQTDMSQGVAPYVPPPDTTPPSAPGALSANASSGQVTLSWGAATDNVGVAHYNVYRSTTSGFTPDSSNRIAQPTGTSYNDGGLPAGTYYYRVTAEDSAGNGGSASNEASATVTAPDTSAPSVAITAPGAGSVSGPVTFSATASDDRAVAGVQFKVDGQNLGSEDATSPYAVTWDTRGELNGTHTLTAVARDAGGNATTSAAVTVTVANAGVSPTGLRAAYALDEGSGSSAADSSGNNKTGTLAGATWTSSGRFGAGVSLNGVSGEVDPPALGTFYKTGFTLEAWVNKQTTKVDTGIVGTWDASQGGGAMLWVDHLSGHYRLTLGSSIGNYLDSGRAPLVGQWQHIAATYDGTTAHFYVDGVETASTTFTGNVGNSNVWRIGAYGASSGGFFDGSIDNVRIYDRPLSATEIQTDMASRIQPDRAAPSAPGTLSASNGTGQVSLSWGAATDDVGVARYDVYRSTTSGFTPGASNRVAQPSGTNYTDTGLAPGTYYYRVTAEDGAGNVGPPSNEASGTALGTDETPPTVSLTAPADGATVGGVVTVTANASDNRSVAGVQFKVDGHDVGAEDTGSPYSVSWDTRGEANGPHNLTAVARDGDGNTTTSSVVGVTVNNSGVSTTGLRAAYSFDDGSGTNALDSSGNNRTATLSGTTWTSAGHFGNALSFNGLSGEADPPALGTFYKTGFTLEAWVYKQSPKVDVGVVGSWTSAGGPMIWVDHLSGHYRLTLGNNISTYLDSGVGPLIGQWQHVAATYDGTTARFYIDGTQVASSTFTGNVGDSNNWRIGAYGSPAGGFFDGTIDNVRIYDRALSAAEIGTDMATRIPSPDTTPPSAPGTLSVSSSFNNVTLNWGAASDNVGVAKYDVYRSTTTGFAPSAGNRIAQPSGTSYVDSGLAAGTYYYKVAAEDAAGNVGAASNEATATAVGDGTPPTVTLTAPAAGTVSGVVTVSANASDDQSVAGVQFKLDGQNLGAEVTSSPYSFAWDTRASANGTHTLTAVARDLGGNLTTSSAVTVTVNNSGVSTTGLRAAYAFDDGSGTSALDSSSNHQTATLAGGAAWGSGHFGGAVTLNGTSSEVDPPALGTFYKTGFTLEAWVKKQTSKLDVAVLGSWTGNGGPMIWSDHINGHYRLTLGTNLSNYLDSGQSPAIGVWQHLAATYDGTTARFYIDGTQVATSTFTGNVGDSNNWRIGAYGSPAGGFFDGSIDNVRIYDRALSQSEIQTDMTSAIQPDRDPPTVTTKTPLDGATQVSVGGTVTARFSEPMQSGSITTSTFKLQDASNTVVPATVSYDATTKTATLKPQSALQFASTYHAVLIAGGAQDLAGNGLAADVSWAFTTESSQPPILLVTSAANPFSSYLAEILRAEGLNDFTSIDASYVTPSFLSGFDAVLLGDVSLTSAQVSALTAWVNAGGNLIASRPDKQLAGLLGITDTGATVSNAYLKVDTSGPPGAGIVGATMQFHGTADEYSLNGATAVATLYSDASTATTSPAVTLRSVGTSGGQAAAFTYDLARSVVLTRQGNPAWAGQERDGVLGIRADDMFYPDWLDTSKIAIPQADEQQRLLANLITTMSRDELPLPRFWYLPRSLKAVIVMSGDDHSITNAPGGTASIFSRFEQLSPPGCNVANWECIRGTSWLYPTASLTDAQAATFLADGFEMALHPSFGSCPTGPVSQAQLSSLFDTQLQQFATKYPSLPPPVSSRTHCVYWPDWSTEAKVELAHGIRMDGNYYHYPQAWIGDKPGFLTGGGFPMRFADLDGSPIDVYQQNTNMNDEAGQQYPATVDALLDNALGPNGYYGAFGTNIHTDFPAPNADDEAIVASAQARGVPIITYKQMLDWTDGRNASTIRSLSWSSGTLSFTTTVGSGATGLQAMLPTQGPSGTLTAITHSGSPVPFTVQTIKGVEYAFFAAANGAYQATYS